MKWMKWIITVACSSPLNFTLIPLIFPLSKLDKTSVF